MKLQIRAEAISIRLMRASWRPASGSSPTSSTGSTSTTPELSGSGQNVGGVRLGIDIANDIAAHGLHAASAAGPAPA